MSFRVTHDVWLKTESARIETLLLMPRFWGRIWDDKSLTAELNAIGLPYTLKQVQELNGELHKRGIVEDIIAPAAEPSAEPATPV